MTKKYWTDAPAEEDGYYRKAVRFYHKGFWSIDHVSRHLLRGRMFPCHTICGETLRSIRPVEPAPIPSKENIEYIENTL